MDLYTGLIPFLMAFVVVAAAAGAVALAVVVDFVASNRRERLARHESIGTYYRGLALTH